MDRSLFPLAKQPSSMSPPTIEVTESQKKAIQELIDAQIEAQKESKSLFEQAVQKKNEALITSRSIEAYIQSILDHHEVPVDRYTYRMDSGKFFLKEETETES